MLINYLILAFVIILLLGAIGIFFYSQRSLDHTKRTIIKKRLKKWQKKHHHKPDEELIKIYEQELEQTEGLSTELIEERIVALRQVKGQWTEKYLADRLDLLAELLSLNKKSSGYWVNYISVLGIKGKSSGRSGRR